MKITDTVCQFIPEFGLGKWVDFFRVKCKHLRLAGLDFNTVVLITLFAYSSSVTFGICEAGN